MAEPAPSLALRLRHRLVAPVRGVLGQQRMLDWYFAGYWLLRGAAYRLARLARPGTTPRIAVISMWDENQAALAAITGPNKAAYCRRHGYAWLPQTAGFVAERPLAWSKIAFLRRLLPAYDWVMWSDADSLITNPALRLEPLVDQPADLLITCDHNGVNTGSFLLRNCAWSRRFLEELWELPAHPDYTPAYELWSDRMWDNRAFLLHLARPESRRHCRFLPQRRLNSYHPQLTEAGPASRHRPGDFVLHLPGIDNATRLQVLSDYARASETPPAPASPQRAPRPI